MQPFFMSKFKIKIDGTIGWDNTKQSVAKVLDANKGVPVSVRMSSLGGILDDGLGMMNYFKDHKNVTCYLYEFNASATTIAAMGAKKVVMDANSFFLIHGCSNFVLEWGSMNQDEMQEAIDRLQKNQEDNKKIDEVMVGIYAKKTGLPADRIMKLMKRAAWLNATEALALGFVDEIENVEDRAKVTASLTSDVVAKFNSANVKLPPLPILDNPSETFLDKVTDRIGSFFGLKPFTATTDPVAEIQKIEMSKKFKLVSAIIESDDVVLEDGKCTLTDEQLTLINNGIEAKDNSIAEKEAEIEELNAQIAALKEQPGDSTQEPEADKDKSNDYTAASELYSNYQKS